MANWHLMDGRYVINSTRTIQMKLFFHKSTHVEQAPAHMTIVARLKI